MQLLSVPQSVGGRDHRHKTHHYGRHEHLRELYHRRRETRQLSVKTLGSGRVPPRGQKSGLHDTRVYQVDDRHYGRSDSYWNSYCRYLFQNGFGRLVLPGPVSLYPQLYLPSGHHVDDEHDSQASYGACAGSEAASCRSSLLSCISQHLELTAQHQMSQKKSENHPEELFRNLRYSRRPHLLHPLEISSV